MQETINLLHTTIDYERSELIMADRLKDDLLNQVLKLQNQCNKRKEKVEKLESELKDLYDSRGPVMKSDSIAHGQNLSNRNKNVGQSMNV